MDVVILAGGKNQRLRGIVAPYMKPLLVVNGQSLLINAVRLSLEATGRQSRIIVVTAPQNTLAISEVLTDAGLADSVDLVVQPSANGPGDAILRAFRMVETTNAMILLGDNYLHPSDVENCYRAAVLEPHQEALVVGYQRKDRDGEYFTRICENGDIIEGVPGGRWADGQYRIWVGPLVLPVTKAKEMLGEIDPDGDELKVGKYLGRLGMKPTLIPVASEDVGTPDWLMGQQWIRKEMIEPEPYDHAGKVKQIFEDQISGANRD